jgi:beta-lactam-binding protein with PASTA domain/predicted Ser/Thr protein kinase
MSRNEIPLDANVPGEGGGPSVEHTTVNSRYRIDARIGDGGMAEVYLGHDLLLNRPVAVKVLREQFARDASVRLRFEREAQAAANFAHPHIVEVYDVGEHDGSPYIVMEYVKGETLKQVIDEEGPFDPDDVSALLEQIGSALDYAHARGVVHRDVKPQNILVDGDGLAKVADFGIAKAIADSNLTETGTGIGTVHYLSPEQANGLMATPSSDVYSLGVVAFEMLTQTLPFDAESPVAVAVAHTRDEPPRPSEIEPTITGAVDAIVLKALEKNPTRRYRSAGEFAETMSDWKHYRPANRPRGGTPGNGWHDAAPPDGYATPHPLDSDPTVALPTDLARQQRGLPVAPPPANDAVWAAPAGRPGGSQVPYRPSVSPPVAPAPVMAGDGRRSDVGCGTWVTGAVVLLALIGLILIGARYSDGLPDHLPTLGFGSGDTRDATPAASAAVPDASATAAEAGVPAPTATVVAQTTSAPDLVGLTIEQARAALDDQGLSVNVTSESRYSDTVPQGQIAQQDPPAGTEIDRGSVVDVILSRGPATVDLGTLELIGQPVDAAVATLERAGLQVVQQPVGSKTVPKGSVAQIDPTGVVAPASAVTVFVSQGDTILLPAGIFGLNRETAITQLTEAGFTVTGEDTANRAAIEAAGVDLVAASIEDGDVVGVQNADQTAGFGTWLPSGTELTLVSYDASRDAEGRIDDAGTTTGMVGRNGSGGRSR